MTTPNNAGQPTQSPQDAKPQVVPFSRCEREEALARRKQDLEDEADWHIERARKLLEIAESLVVLKAKDAPEGVVSTIFELSVAAYHDDLDYRVPDTPSLGDDPDVIMAEAPSLPASSDEDVAKETVPTLRQHTKHRCRYVLSDARA